MYLDRRTSHGYFSSFWGFQCSEWGDEVEWNEQGLPFILNCFLKKQIIRKVNYTVVYEMISSTSIWALKVVRSFNWIAIVELLIQLNLCFSKDVNIPVSRWDDINHHTYRTSQTVQIMSKCQRRLILYMVMANALMDTSWFSDLVYHFSASFHSCSI